MQATLISPASLLDAATAIALDGREGITTALTCSNDPWTTRLMEAMEEHYAVILAEDQADPAGQSGGLRLLELVLPDLESDADKQLVQFALYR